MTITIIGGGAAGLISAITAAYTKKDNTEIIILERLDRVGKKILSTGNGRCNFTNVYSHPDNFHGLNPQFVSYALETFSPYSAIDFFESLGVLHKTEENGRVYPYSLQASAILDVLRRETQRLGIKTITECTVKKIEKRNNKFSIITNKNTLFSDKIIITTGGCAAPKLGSDGSGFNILKSLGHKITVLSPALVQLKTKSEIVKGLKGIKVLAEASLKEDNKIIKRDTGEVLFTDYGLSGPPIFQISCRLEKNKKYSVCLDLTPDINKKDLFNILKNRRKILSPYTMEEFFTGMLNKKVGFAIAKKAGIQKLSAPILEVCDKMLSEMCRLIKCFEFEISGTNGFDNAQVTAGGVLSCEFNEKTMESKIVRNMYCAGEIFDIYGDCGGHNLQWAWSSGYLAGKSAVLKN